ncbi:MAG: (d)CMP kinase [Clostridia bacterium]|nr:(d)CMP kinase [Clostridia bacterium]
MSFQIAIDGPSASGKTEVAKKLSEILNITAIDTGAIYRAFTLFCLKENVDINDNDSVIALIPKVEVNLSKDKVYLNGEDVSLCIRSNEVSIATSIVAKICEVREFVSSIQRKIANSTNVVMQGRDITSVVLPNAQIKIFLTASIEVRAKRRFLEMQAKGQNDTYEEVLENLKIRDKNDITRDVSPLVKTEDSVEIDSSDLTVDQVVKIILDIVYEKGLV